ncbi:phage integrase SAM-like domain-containing protein [Flectobacillus sp. DC10W]|uniref:Phage integrase SAM-like domain-containing protein n=1 Tax=Flectobacillus longus TaxID=2984207 RepID=A0ABT6YRW4_9BACT|nr:phage integrase SAM-like domain-containing protein [Flectobacillus longus]MDI9866318.1 phage integrase SAM-like domain-containing protein [Flectobacillus longus]
MEIRFCEDGKQPNSKGLVNLKVGIALEGYKTLWTASGIQVPSNTFDTHYQVCTSKNTQIDKSSLEFYNNRLVNIRKKFEAIKNSFEYERMAYSPEDIIQQFKSPVVKPITFIALIEKTLAEYSTHLTHNTIKSHKSSAENVKEYLAYSNQTTILAGQINTDFLRKLEIYFKTIHIPKSHSHGLKLKSTSIKKLITFVLKVISFGVDTEVVNAKELKYKVNTNDVSQDYSHLTQQEVQSLEKLSPFVSEKYQKVIDSFLWMCYTGQSHVDTSGLTQAQIHKLDSELTMLGGKRSKTKIDYTVVMNDKALILIEKYGSVEKIPVLHLTTINEELKIIGKILSFKISLSTKIARRTFGQYWYKKTDIADKFVSKMLGHNKADTKKYYVNLDMEDVAHAVKTAKVLN